MFNYDYVSPLELDFKITNNREKLLLARRLFHKVSISKKLSKPDCYTRVNQTESAGKRADENKSGWRGNGLGLRRHTPDNLYCIHPVLCLHMARISKTVNLNNSFAEGKSGAREMLVLMTGISIIYSKARKPDKMDELLTFCWKSHRIIWRFAASFFVLVCSRLLMMGYKLKYVLRRKRVSKLVSIKFHPTSGRI